jgi:hypothetical protein
MKEMQQQYGMAQKKEPEINNTKYDLENTQYSFLVLRQE